MTKNICSHQNDGEVEKLFCADIMMTFHNFLVIAWVTQCCVHKTLRIIKKVKVSHSLIAVGAVGVRFPLYLGHS